MEPFKKEKVPEQDKLTLGVPGVPGVIAKLAAGMLPVMARKRATKTFPVHSGASFFYELDSGWETRILEQDDDVRTVRSTLDLEDAFSDEKVKTILIPDNSSITRHVAMRVSRRHGQGKTVFYEVNESE